MRYSPLATSACVLNEYQAHGAILHETVGCASVLLVFEFGKFGARSGPDRITINQLRRSIILTFLLSLLVLLFHCCYHYIPHIGTIIHKLLPFKSQYCFIFTIPLHSVKLMLPLPMSKFYTLPKKRGPKAKIFRGPLPEHLKLLARLCIKHDGPGNLTYWNRIFEEAERDSEELHKLILEKQEKYPTFKKSRLRFLVDRQYRHSFNDYRAKNEASMGKLPSPRSVTQLSGPPKTTAAPLPHVAPRYEADLSQEGLANHLMTFAASIAESELSTGGKACWDCLRRNNDIPQLEPLFEANAPLDPDMQRVVFEHKNFLKRQMTLDRSHDINNGPHVQFDYKVTIDGFQYFQQFLTKCYELLQITKEERSLPEIFKEFAFHFARARLYKSVYKNEWAFLHRQPICMALRTLLQKNRKVLVTCTKKDCFKTFLHKILPLVKAMERPRMNVVTCRSCAGCMKQADKQDDAVTALLSLSQSSDYSSDGSA